MKYSMILFNSLQHWQIIIKIYLLWVFWPLGGEKLKNLPKTKISNEYIIMTKVIGTFKEVFATLKLPCFSNKFHQLEQNLLCRWWSFYMQELLTISCLLMTEFLVFWSPNEPESQLSACSLLASLFNRYKRKTSLKSVNTTDLTLGLFIETVSWGDLIPLLQIKNIYW